MPVKNYGVWRGTPTSYIAQHARDDPRSPHVTIKFSDSSSTQNQANVNVKSISGDHRLVYWFDHNFQHPITDTLRDLPSAFRRVTDPNDDLALDYQRTSPALLSFSSGLLLPHDIPGPDNDILDELLPTLDRAISSDQNSIFVFGSSYGTGTHDVHMNQGSAPKFDNGIGSDGALIFYFADSDHFEAVFLAFASQTVPTDDRGLATRDSVPLSRIARSLDDERDMSGRVKSKL